MKRKSKTLALLWFVITGIWIVTLTLTLLSENRSGLLIGAQIVCIVFSLITALLNLKQTPQAPEDTRKESPFSSDENTME